MNANPVLPSGAPLAPRRTSELGGPRSGSPMETMPVPASWRAGQLVVLALIAALALIYNLMVVPWPQILKAGSFANWPIADNLGFVVLAAVTWLATPTAGTIAYSTLQEAIRRRWVIGFVLFSMLVIGFSSSLTFVQLGEEQRFLQDFGIGFIIAMTILIAIFLGVTLVPPEIERRTILTILSKPVNRVEFLLGKFLGLCLTLFLCTVLLGAFFLLIFVAFSLRQNPAAWTTGTVSNPDATLSFQTLNLAKALLLHFGQLIVLAALSMLLSLIVTPITAITFCFLAYFGGQMSSYWGHLGGDGHANEGEGAEKGLSGPMQNMVKMVYYVLPRMDRFDVRQQLVTDTNVALASVWQAWSSGLLYVAVLLTIAYLVFSDREF